MFTYRVIKWLVIAQIISKFLHNMQFIIKYLKPASSINQELSN